MTVNYYLDRKPCQTESAIFMYVRGIGGTVKIHTGEKISSDNWDATKQKAKNRYVGSPELNTYLSNLKEEVKKRYRLFMSEQPQATFHEVKNLLLTFFDSRHKAETHVQFFAYWDLFVQVKTAEKHRRTIQKYKTLIAHLQQFQAKKKYRVSFETITLEFYEQFIAFLIQELGHTNNTIGKYLSTLKTFMRWATERGYNQKQDFVKFKIPSEKADIIYLAEDELMRLYSLDLSNNKTLEKVRDVFCFGCFTGQRFSDIATLNKDDIRNGSWYLRTQKTKDALEIPLNDYALELIDKYHSEERFFPIISHQKTNTYLKKVGKVALIDEPLTLVKYRGAERLEQSKPKYHFLTTHTARRTFVTLSLEKGMRPETVMEITGHKDYKTFKKYIKLTSKVKAAEMRQIWKKAQ